jgi:hypothetical protein
MKALLLALDIRSRYNKMELKDSIKEFEEYTNQKVPQQAIEDFRFCGLNNVDFFTSNFLEVYGLKNLYHFDK